MGLKILLKKVTFLTFKKPQEIKRGGVLILWRRLQPLIPPLATLYYLSHFLRGLSYDT
jgi:hypothetical protein